ncbi:MAG TPA: hypothetical protein VNA68_01240 [Candidatus Dormibacteraeota bacterium]|nr:hypothetical protein [Candidatus Dormibacteraeota bacterium]
MLNFARFGRLRNQKGGASLLAVVFTSFLIILITVAMASQMSGELRQATDAENSIKAYYEAESKAEEVALDIIEYLDRIGKDPSLKLSGLNQGCVGVPGTPLNILPADPITCIRILAVGSPPPTDISVDNTLEFDLSGLDFDYVKINFGPQVEGNTDPANLPLLETTMTNYQGNDVSQTSTVLLDPRKTTGCNPDPNGRFTFYYGRPEAEGANYACRVTPPVTKVGGETPYEIRLNKGAPGSAVLRFRPRQRSAVVKFQLFKDDGTRIEAIPFKYAYVDITAKIGESYRRIIKNVPVKSSPLPPADVIYSDTDICKDFELVTATGFDHVRQVECPVFIGEN